MEFLPSEGVVWDTVTLSSLHLVIAVSSKIVNEGLLSTQRWLDRRLYLVKFAKRDEWTGGDCRRMLRSQSLAQLQEIISMDAAAGTGSDKEHPAQKFHDCLVAWSYLVANASWLMPRHFRVLRDA